MYTSYSISLNKRSKSVRYNLEKSSKKRKKNCRNISVLETITEQNARKFKLRNLTQIQKQNGLVLLRKNITPARGCEKIIVRSSNRSVRKTGEIKHAPDVNTTPRKQLHSIRFINQLSLY